MGATLDFDEVALLEIGVSVTRVLDKQQQVVQASEGICKFSTVAGQRYELAPVYINEYPFRLRISEER